MHLCQADDGLKDKMETQSEINMNIYDILRDLKEKGPEMIVDSCKKTEQISNQTLL